MERDATPQQLLPYQEILVLLYMYCHSHFVFPTRLIRMPDLSNLSFLRTIYGDELSSPLLVLQDQTKCQELLHKNERIYSTKLSNASKPWWLQLSKDGYGFYNENPKQFKQFLERYLNAYKEHQFHINTGNFYSFQLSWERTISFLNQQKEQYGDSFIIDNNTIQENFTIINPHVRWVESILWALLQGKVKLQKAEVNFTESSTKDKALSSSNDYNLDILEQPKFSFTIQLLQPLHTKTNIVAECMKIEIEKNSKQQGSDVYRVFYKGHLVPFDFASIQFFFLYFLIKYHGVVQSTKTFKIEFEIWHRKILRKPVKQYKGNIEDRLENYRIEILKKFRKVCSDYAESLDFDITAGKNELYLHEHKRLPR